MSEIIQIIYEELKPGGWVLLFLFMVGVVGWSQALWWNWAVHGCSDASRSTLQDWIRTVADGDHENTRLDPHERTLLQQFLEPFQRRHPRTNSRLRSLLDTVVSASRHRYRSGMRFVGVCATILPLLGLFGTLLGIIQSFDVLSLSGAPDVRLLSTGISRALITTQAGLLLALPLVFFYRYMHTQAKRHEKNMELVAHCLLRHRQSMPELTRNAFQREASS